MSQFTVEAFLKATGAKEFSNSMKEAGDSVNNIGKHTKSATGGLGSFMSGIGKIAGAIGVTQLVSAGFVAIKNSVGDAVDRVDTLKRFPQMMEAMGFSADESKNAVNRLKDGIQGLPTPLDDVVSTAQKLAIMTGDLDGATKVTLALNNAFLANGSSSADAQRGLQQYTQMLSSGKVDMQSWRTLQETMGVALDKTAKSFGFAGESAQNDLYAALQDGSITFEDFNNKIVELDAGVGGFAEMAQTASKGIKTSMTNIKTAITTGVANAIVAVDEAMQAGGFGSISDNLNKVKVKVQEAFALIVASIGPFVASLIETVSKIKEFTTTFAPLIAGIVGAIAVFNILSTVIPILVTAFQGLMIIKTLVTSVGLLTTAGAFLAPIIGALNIPMLLVVGAIGLLIAAGVALWQNWDIVKAKTLEVWGAIEGYVMPVVTAITSFIMSSFAILTSWWVANQQIFYDTARLAWELIKVVFSSVTQIIVAVVRVALDAIKSFWSIWGSTITSIVTAAWGIISSVFKTTLNNILAVVKFAMTQINITITAVMNIIKGITKVALSVMKGDWSGAMDGIKSIVSAFQTYVTSTFGNLMETAKSLVSNGVEGIKGVFDSLKNIDLFSAGKAIIDGFLRGLKSAYEGVKTFVGGIATWIKDHKGPISYDKKLLIGAGNAIMDGLDRGLQSSFKDVQSTVNGMSGAINNAFSGGVNPSMDINGSIARSNAQVNSRVSHEINNAGKQPAYVNFSLGGKSYRGFVDDISNAQNSQIQLTESYL